MDISGLWTLQIMMFLLVTAGAILKRKGILKDEGKEILTDIVLYVFLPCNIINSFRIELEDGILVRLFVILGISIAIQGVCYGLSRLLYYKKPEARRRVLQYCTIVSNSGFLGLPIAEGIYGTPGMMYASIFIIPMRVMMWSAGLACFTESPDWKTVVKKVAFHPCIIAVYIGLAFLFLQMPLERLYQGMMENSGPALQVILSTVVHAMDKAIRSAGNCTTAMTMLLIGMMLADVRFKDLFDLDAIGISVVRLGVLPLIVFVGCRMANLDPFISGICVLMSGMPAGSTAAILASKYNCDYMFATKCVVVSTLLSMLTIPLWGMWS